MIQSRSVSSGDSSKNSAWRSRATARRVAGAGDDRVLDQVVVLAEADEDGAEDPGDGDLGHAVFAPHLEGGRGALGVPRRLPFPAELGGRRAVRDAVRRRSASSALTWALRSASSTFGSIMRLSWG